MKLNNTLLILFITLFYVQAGLTQTCITSATLDGTLDNTSATFVIPAGTLTDVSYVSISFTHTYIGDIDMNIDDGTTTVTLYDGLADGSENSSTTGMGNFSDNGATYNSTSQDLSQEEVLLPFSGTLASLNAGATITLTLIDNAGGDPYTFNSSSGIVIGSSDGGTVHFIPTTASCPTNDEICNATPLTFDIGTNSGSANTSTNLFATQSAGEPTGTNFNAESGSTFNSCGTGAFTSPGNPGYSTWHSITPAVTGEHCFAEGIGGFGVDFQMALYSGTVGCPANDYSGLTLMATSDDDGVGGVGPMGIAYSSNSISAPANTGGDAAFCVNLTAGTTYYLQMSTVALFSQTSPGGGCDVSFASWTAGTSYTLTVTEPDIPVECNDCIDVACNTNPVQTDFGTSEANFGGDCWDAAIGATPTTNVIVTADVAGTETVCTDFDPSGTPDFMGFDNCISFIDQNGTAGFQNTAFTTSWTMYQEVAGACVALVPTNTNVYGQYEFDNNVTAGTTPGDPGSYDPSLPITYCYTYTSNGAGAAGDDDVQGNIPVAYGCTEITALSAGVQSACDPGTNTYTQEVTVTIANLPAAGGTTNDREVNINGQTFTMTAATNTFTLTGLTADAAAVDVTGFMSVSTGCTFTSTALFTAPANCTPVCDADNGTWN